MMKKFSIANGLLVTFVLFLTSSAFAVPFQWDMSLAPGYTATGATVTGDIVNFPIDMTTSGGSTISQSLTGGDDDTILDDGDTFTEFGGLTVLGTSTSPPPSTNEKSILFNGGAANAYIYFSGLAGEILNHNDGGTPTTGAATIVDDTFDLTFYPGEGFIGIYLDDNFDPFDGGNTLELATLSLLSGAGTSPIPVGDRLEGQFDLIAGFLTVLPDFWRFADGTTFNDWMDTYGVPSIFASSFNLGATLFGAPTDVDGNIQLVVANEGSFEITAIPEPSTFLLMAAGLLGLGFIVRRKRQ